jgi:hypothetical protein
MAVQAKCDEKKQVVYVLLCGTVPFAKCAKDEPPPELFMTARSKALGHPAALKSHPSKNEGWGTRQTYAKLVEEIAMRWEDSGQS